MSERDFYPAGAYDDPKAPWNEQQVKEREFNVEVTITMTKNIALRTNNYVPEYNEECEMVFANTYDTNWEQEYKDNCYTIHDLLGELEGYIKQDLERYKGNRRKEYELKKMLADCQGWKEYDVECVEQ